ncbi:GapR family DNA-binding domain-containing protein [Aminobacter aganoensis]|uniref:Uncharacterized protein (UPF0335 family) n=1 Tax=Aminobacter aganoensis TaxID=83264 RepID=A0A7X0KJY2_9HYPH|nr:GapR family DNA-binding domain-containing protein [Aminobacter aganoensis]MBB6353517.1 uncharacterized protein (UPF0335 family) [Aminobacter aganoensis]
MSDDTIAFEQFAGFFRRWQEIEDAKGKLGDESKDLFADMKGGGYDTKATRAVFRDKRKELNADPAEVQEQEAMYDLYMNALNKGLSKAPARPAPAHVENIEKNRSDNGANINMRHSGIATDLPPHDEDGVIFEDHDAAEGAASTLSQGRPVNPTQEPADSAEQSGDESSAIASPSTDRSSTTSSAPEASTPSEVNEVSGADLSDEVDAHEITRHRPLTGDGGHLSEPSSDAGAGVRAVVETEAVVAKSEQAANQISEAEIPAFLKPVKEPGCLNPASCKIKSLSVLCSGCANERTKSRAAA